MIELAKLKIRDVDQRINEMPFDELDERIDFIYSLGYSYNPYIKEFFNPFINQGLKALVVYNLDINRIQNIHDSFEKDYIKKNNKIISVEEIKKSVDKNDNGSGLFMFLASESVIYSILLFIVAIIAHFFGAIIIATLIIALSFVLINCYINYNLLYSKNENEYDLSSFWLKNKNKVLLFSLILYTYFYYLLYNSFNNFFLPVVVILLLSYLAKKYIAKELINRYWGIALYHLWK